MAFDKINHLPKFFEAAHRSADDADLREKERAQRKLDAVSRAGAEIDDPSVRLDDIEIIRKSCRTDAVED